MAKTANINIRIDPETKSSAEELFASFGITITDAINIFLRKSLMEGGLPFEVKQPRYNVETEVAIREAKAIMEGQIQAKQYSSAKALFEELNAEAGDK
ncbi:type II toxin-antitoxin system RelB/DinJ family antitoxin [Bariatricus sp. SGI.154]|uniref:type II toxin-antitoxin system RelB/DinJ family antitoxin n=1 Tax=Bariatricus sp. SGI.154 TaxID=3420549 RepID=UPI003D027E3A